MALGLCCWIQENITDATSQDNKLTSMLGQCLPRVIPQTLKGFKVSCHKIWSHYHTLHSSQHYVNGWETFMRSTNITNVNSAMCHQYVGHHMFKGLIESHFSVALSAASDEDLHYPLTDEEINAITYSAGYVLHAIKKKLLKVKTPCPLTKDMLLCLDDMISSDNEINGSRDWIELVNPGGLTCVNSITYEVFLAMKLHVVNTLVHNYKLSYTLNKEISVDDSVISYKGRTLALNTLRAKINPITGVAHTVNNGVRERT